MDEMRRKSTTGKGPGASLRTARAKEAPARRNETFGASGTSAGDGLYQRIFDAIIDHRLLPGAKLGEDQLADVLAATRPRVRDALARLAHEKLVTIIPYRGAFVAGPSIAEARQIYAARRVIEAFCVREFARSATAAQIRTLESCVNRERAAWTAGNRTRAIENSRRFHLQIADMAGNAVLADVLRGIISRVALVIALYDRPGNPDCFFAEHVDVLAAIVARDEDRAAQLIADHLQHMEDHLNLVEDAKSPRDLHDVFHGGR